MNEWGEWLSGPGAEAASAALLHFVWQGAALWAAAALSLRALAARPAALRHGVACSFLAAMAAAPVATWWLLTSKSAAGFGIAGGAIPGASLFAWPRTAAGGDAGPPWVLLLWLAGVSLSSLRVATAWLRTAARMTRGRRPVADALTGRARELAARLGVPGIVRVFASSRISVPAMWGVVRPVVLLPAGLVTGLPPAQLEAILAHELAHAARWDFAVNALQCVVETLLFYHPGVWWVSRAIRREREMACDEMAAELCGDRAAYSRALLAVEESRLVGALAAGGGDLKTRVAWLLLRPAPAGRAPGVALGVALALLGITAWSVLRVPAIAVAETAVGEAERQRRLRYANERYADGRPGAETDRGRLYVKQGPPDEIASFPSEHREFWRYRDGREYEFSGERYRLVRKSRSKPAVVEGISVEQLPEPARARFGKLLARYAGRPASSALMDEVQRKVYQADPAVDLHWTLDLAGSGSVSLVLRPRSQTPDRAGPRLFVSGEAMRQRLIHAPPPRPPRVDAEIQKLHQRLSELLMEYRKLAAAGPDGAPKE